MFIPTLFMPKPTMDENVAVEEKLTAEGKLAAELWSKVPELESCLPEWFDKTVSAKEFEESDKIKMPHIHEDQDKLAFEATLNMLSINRKLMDNVKDEFKVRDDLYIVARVSRDRRYKKRMFVAYSKSFCGFSFVAGEMIQKDEVLFDQHDFLRGDDCIYLDEEQLRRLLYSQKTLQDRLTVLSYTGANAVGVRENRACLEFVARYSNHSSNPAIIENHDSNDSVAARDLKPFEHLTTDYEVWDWVNALPWYDDLCLEDEYSSLWETRLLRKKKLALLEERKLPTGKCWPIPVDLKEETAHSTNDSDDCLIYHGVSNEVHPSTKALAVILDGPEEKVAKCPAYYCLKTFFGGQEQNKASYAYTHLRLHKDASRVAAFLRSFTSAPSSPTTTKRVVLAVSCEAKYEILVVILACFKNAFSYVNICDLVDSPNVNDILDTLQPSILVTDSLTHKRFPSLADYVLQTEEPTALLSIDEILGVPSIFSKNTTMRPYSLTSVYTPESFPLDNEAVVFFTSGSSGKPKMAASTFQAIILSALRVQYLVQYNSSSVNLSLTGFEDSAMFILSCFPSLLYGAAIVSTASDSYSNEREKKLLKTIPGQKFLRDEITSISLVPSKLSLMTDCLQTTGSSPKRTILTNGAKLMDSTVEDAAKIFNNPKILNCYGSTETNLIGVQIMSESSNKFVLADGVEMKIKRINSSEVVDDDESRRLLLSNNIERKTSSSEPNHDYDGIVGNVFVRSDMMMMGYVGQKPLGDEDWYATGDIGCLNTSDRTFVLTGRTRETINFEGDELHPAEILNAWGEVLPQLEMTIVRDQYDATSGQSAVLFIEEKHPSSASLVVSAEAMETSVRSISFDNEKTKAEHLLATSAVCMVDEFPRRGVRQKIDVLALEKLYMQNIKPELVETGKMTNRMREERVYVSMVLNKELDQFEILAIEVLQKMRNS